MNVDLPVPRSALAIGAHPDDIEFECGATLAKWAASGATVHLLICTDGRKGTWDHEADIAALIEQRQAEQQEAARRLGAAGQVRFLGQVDGELDMGSDAGLVSPGQALSGLALRGEVARIIRELTPQVVLAHDPWRRWRMHPDHRAAGFLAVDAVVAARDPHYYPEHGLAAHRPEALLLFECEEPDHLESAEKAHVEAKTHALLAHRSQFVTTMAIDDADDGTQLAAFEQRMLDEARDQGRRGGVGLGEAFRLLDPAS